VLEIIKKTLLGAIGFVIEYKFNFIRILILPCILLSLFQLIVAEGINIWIFIFFTVFEWVVYIQVAISTHRLILLGPSSVSTWGFYVPGFRELHFFGAAFVLGLLLLPFDILSQAIYSSQTPLGGWVIPYLLSSYFWGRFALVFPSIATDNELSFQESWNITRNYQVLMIAVVGIYPLLVELPSLLISTLPYTEVISTVISLVSFIFVVSALSVAFLVINKHRY
tara:strand:- start:1923 stop:2594 length:672 start_codon:yes stop_codon:yes gene_type:complete